MMDEKLDRYMAVMQDIREMCMEIDEALHDANPDDIRQWDMGRAEEIRRRLGKVIKYVRETRGM
jgi:hypothetical protein